MIRKFAVGLIAADVVLAVYCLALGLTTQATQVGAAAVALTIILFVTRGLV